MGFYLNNREPFSMYQEMVKNPYFVDKTAMIHEIIPRIGITEKYICITRPRRFGKSVAASMLGAFFSKACDSTEMFDRLEISNFREYQEHINQYNVIYIDFSAAGSFDSYKQYISEIEMALKGDLKREYPNISFRAKAPVFEDLKWINLETGDKFIFILDEWDMIFHKASVCQQERAEYLNFLRLLLKGRAYVALAYMTGILPIASCLTPFVTQESDDSFVGASGESLPAVFPADAPYSSGSELNMFLEYTMASEKAFDDCFGFTEREVDNLFERYKRNGRGERITRQGLKEWYDGYHTCSGERMYNPRSVVAALTNDNLGNYWTGSGPYDEIYYYIRNNVGDVRESLALMVSGEAVPARIKEYAATSMRLITRDEIFSAMVVYGFLSFENGKVSIPNQELMCKFEETLRNEETLGYVYRLAKESDRMLEATLAGNVEVMEEILAYAHDTETPLLDYNHETELTAVVNLVYLSARDKYNIQREDKAGIGYVDFIFYPKYDRKLDGIILELKVDSTPEEAIQQIKDKQYGLRFKGKLGEGPLCSGRILAVGIGYGKRTKEHRCKVEVL